MSSVPLDIVDDFLRSSDPQARRNALAALGTIGTSDSAARLVQTAFADADPLVRERAEAELSGLDPDTAAAAVTDIAARLDTPSGEVDAYAMLARLAEPGWVSVATEGSWMRRVPRALRFMLAAPLPLARRLGLAGFAALASLGFSMVVFPMLIMATGLQPGMDDMLLVILGSAALAAAVAFASLVRSLPLRRHADPRAAVIVELGLTLAGAVVVGIGIVAVLIPSGDDISNGTLVSWAYVMAAGAGSAAAARFGVLLGEAQFRAPWHVLISGSVGTAFGVTASCALLAAAGALSGPGYSAASTPFVLFIIASAGVAFASARLNATSSARAPFPRALSLLAAAAAILVIVSVPLAALERWVTRAGPRVSAGSSIQLALPASGDGVRKVETAGADPMYLFWSSEAAQNVEISVNDPLSRDLRIQVHDLGGNQVVAEADDPDPATLQKELPGGEYMAIVGLYTTIRDLTPGTLQLDRVPSALTRGAPALPETPFTTAIEPYDIHVAILPTAAN